MGYIDFTRGIRNHYSEYTNEEDQYRDIFNDITTSINREFKILDNFLKIKTDKKNLNNTNLEGYL